MDNRTLSFYSFNARGLNTYKKRVILFDWLHDTNIDIICLQETHFIENQKYFYDSRWFGKKFHCFSDSVHSRGVTILFKKNIDIEVINHHFSQDGRKLLINFKYKENIFSLVNVYLPNHEKPRVDFLKRLLTWVNQNATNHDNLIVCGDFNCQLDKSNDKSSSILKKFINMFNLTDSWTSSAKSQDQGFTWCDANNRPQSRIDYVFISKNIVHMYIHYVAYSYGFSDYLEYALNLTVLNIGNSMYHS